MIAQARFRGGGGGGGGGGVRGYCLYKRLHSGPLLSPTGHVAHNPSVPTLEIMT